MGLFGSVQVAQYREMEVEAARAWDMLQNVDEFPKLFKRDHLYVKRTNGSKPGDPLFVGMTWAESRLPDKGGCELKFTVTNLDKGEGKPHTFPRSVSFLVATCRNSMSTSTVQVDRISDHRCIVMETTVIIPSTIRGHFLFPIYYFPLRIIIRRRVQGDLNKISNYLERNPTTRNSTSSLNDGTLSNSEDIEGSV